MATCECPLDWQIDNLAVCVGGHTSFTDTLLFSSSLEDGKIHCDVARPFPQPVPSRAWSEQRISSPCTGAGKLVLRVRQGNTATASESDCVVNEQSFDFDYTAVDAPLALPSVAAWSAQDQTCARAYEESGGYLEFVVQSETLGCGDDGESVKRVNQCPVICDEPGHDKDPVCENCGGTTLSNAF